MMYGRIHRGVRGSILALALGMVMAMSATAVAEEFPLRAKYPTTTPIATADLGRVFGTAVIVDSRNAAEFDVIHIVGAHNILVGKMQEGDLTALRAKDSSAPLVFYCNGVTCSKSYKAAEKAVEWGFQKAFVYDAGVFTWAKTYPDRAEFFGTPLTPETLETSLISDDRFKATLMPPAEFLEKAKGGNYTVVDIRDPNERSETPFTLPGMKTMSFDTFIRMLDKGSSVIPREDLLVVDNVGKQVRWLQYYLERANVRNFHFLEGGVRALVTQGLI